MRERGELVASLQLVDQEEGSYDELEEVVCP